MTLGETLISVWRQALGDRREGIELEGRTYPVTVSKGKGLHMVEFDVGPNRIIGIEQNPRTTSRWAELARQGRRIMQFSHAGRYVGNVCEGKLVHYGAWKDCGLPIAD